MVSPTQPAPPAPLVPAAHNNVFDRLTNRDDKLIGMVAYAFYKQDKKEWIMQQTRTLQEISNYGSNITPTRIDGYNKMAQAQLAEFAESIINDTRTNTMQEAEHSAILKEIRRQSSFWKDVGAGIVAAFLFGLLLVTLGVLLFTPDLKEFVNYILSYQTAKGHK